MIPGSCASINRISSLKNCSTGAPAAIISSNLAWPSSNCSARFRSLISRDTPTTPIIAPCLLRSGSFDVISQRSMPLVTNALSSMPKTGSPFSMMRPSTAATSAANSAGVEIEIGLAEDLLHGLEAIVRDGRLIGEKEATLEILGVDVVGNVVHHRLKPVMAIGDVWFCCNQARHFRSETVAGSDQPARILVAGCLGAGIARGHASYSLSSTASQRPNQGRFFVSLSPSITAIGYSFPKAAPVNLDATPAPPAGPGKMPQPQMYRFETFSVAYVVHAHRQRNTPC